MQADLNWFAVLAHHAILTPDKAFSVFAGEAISYGQLLSYNCQSSSRQSSRRTTSARSRCMVNWRLAAPEVRYILEHSEARALVCVSGPASDGWAALADVRAVSVPPRATVAADDAHWLMYTSGTTGRPKGVMLTHANLEWKNLAHIVESGFTSADLGLAFGPLYHVGALDLTTTSLIAAGATTIIQRTISSAWFADAYGLTEIVSGDTFLDRDSIVTKLDFERGGGRVVDLHAAGLGVEEDLQAVRLRGIPDRIELARVVVDGRRRRQQDPAVR